MFCCGNPLAELCDQSLRRCAERLDDRCVCLCLYSVEKGDDVKHHRGCDPRCSTSGDRLDGCSWSGRASKAGFCSQSFSCGRCPISSRSPGSTVEDYKQAGFVMLASFDPACRVTGRQSLLYTMGLISVSFIPAMLDLTSFWYLPIAAVMGGYFLWMAFRFAISGTDQAAKRLFLASIVYLPVTLAALAFARL